MVWALRTVGEVKYQPFLNPKPLEMGTKNDSQGKQVLQAVVTSKESLCSTEFFSLQVLAVKNGHVQLQQTLVANAVTECGSQPCYYYEHVSSISGILPCACLAISRHQGYKGLFLFKYGMLIRF